MLPQVDADHSDFRVAWFATKQSFGDIPSQAELGTEDERVIGFHALPQSLQSVPPDLRLLLN